MASPEISSNPRQRIRVFVDFWNFQLTLNKKEDEVTGATDSRFRIDWTIFPNWVAKKAADVTGVTDFVYEGAIVYASYSPSGDAALRGWLNSWLNRQPGVQVIALEHQPKGPPNCPVCHASIDACPSCGAPTTGTVEKGIDTALVTDMIRLAWEDAYDIAVLVTSDADMVPAVKYIDTKGRKVIQAGFPPSGYHLATSCWASFDLFALRNEYRRS